MILTKEYNLLKLENRLAVLQSRPITKKNAAIQRKLERKIQNLKNS